MRSVWMHTAGAAAGALLGLTLGSARADDAASKAPSTRPLPPAAAQPDSAQIREAPLAVPVEETQCRRYRPTGSHIASVRCEAKSATESPHARAARQLAKNDLEEMRRRQMAQELVRQQALADALRHPGR
jgi:hypothetical protein